MLLSFEQTSIIAEDWLKSLPDNQHQDLAINHSATIHRPLYVVFFYNSKEYLEKGDLSSALAGNSPIIVDRVSGYIFQTGTAYPIEFYMSEFENNKLPEVDT